MASAFKELSFGADRHGEITEAGTKCFRSLEERAASACDAQER